MKNAINFVLSIVSLFSSVPTGWAIFAGVTKQDVFPMHPVAAFVGAAAIIATSIAAGLLVTDVKAYNQGMKNKAEREELGMSASSAWLVLAGCILAEITLSLLIVVIPGALAYGVLVFPLMTAAGVFAFAARYDLQQRESERATLRETLKKERETRKQERATRRKQVAQPETPVSQPVNLPATVTKQPVTDDELLTFFASNPGATNTDAAQHFHVTRQAIGKRTKKLYAVAQKEAAK